MIRTKIALALSPLAAMLFAGAAPAQAEAALEPASDWRLNQYDDRCRASRSFGAGEDRTTLWIEQGGAEPNYNLTLIGRPVRNPYGGGVHVQFGEEAESIRSYVSAESSRGRPVLMMFGATIIPYDLERDEDAASPENSFDRDRATAIKTLRLRSSIPEPIELALGSMEKPLAYLDECGRRIAALLSTEGRALTGEITPPEPIDEEDWLRDADYPRYLAAAEMEGRLTIRLTVNRQGRPSSCFVTESNKPQLFDDIVCLTLMQRASFEPARDVNGEAVASYYFNRVTFRMR